MRLGNSSPESRALAARLLDELDLELGLTVPLPKFEAAIELAIGAGAMIASAMVIADRFCRVCGCTTERACEGGCSWASRDLCSRCAPFVEGAAA